ncbi:metal-sensitive transcriptional regulator [Lysinibacillus sp. BW-2-10]|uniref:metal-sensitive transcriptional regulator n=1 Tax=Lysinibacillus sp. BW-2-10 TaxID=2590030 RepID=UPI00117BF92E|nr:metal-sensitive transcriptional regulator [Lysinibacillus sp. BW-2-10]TSI09719.1 metal-sensitive transcriptional regulator [Lysinibacillus sp. BW-2-10]
MNSYEVKIKNRIKRIEGQLRGILKMMDEEKDCKAVVTQLSAVRSGVDHTIGVIVSQNLKECILEAKNNENTANDSIQEAMDLLVKSR